MFLPTTKEELKSLGWDTLDIILVTGDVYIDSSYMGAAIIGKVLVKAGYKVGIIAQPDINSDVDISRLGEPTLFWGVTAGVMDSMVANHTALNKFRKEDDLTPGGINNRRPDRAVICYVNMIRRYMKPKVPVIIGGLEASLRRIAHYDFWDNKIRNSILLDAKADILVYGMGEKTILDIASRLKENKSYLDVKGICYIGKTHVESFIRLPSSEQVKMSKSTFANAFNLFYENNDPLTAHGLVQQHGERFLIQNPPQDYETVEELDAIYNLDFEYDAHPYYKAMGNIKGLDTAGFSITTHRGCYGECNFCSISIHQGRTIRSRTEESILKEIAGFSRLKSYKGIIYNVGGPTANMYRIECSKKIKHGACNHRRCLFPQICENLEVNHKAQADLLMKIKNSKGVKQVFVASGIRYDLVLADSWCGQDYLTQIIDFHTSGQLKIAPEHTEDHVLNLLGKPGKGLLVEFKKLFDSTVKRLNKKYFLTYYFMAAPPGCNLASMKKMQEFISRNLHVYPEQIQVFTPTPSTYSSLIYYTGIDPFNGNPVYVETEVHKKEAQKNIMKRQ